MPLVVRWDKLPRLGLVGHRPVRIVSGIVRTCRTIGLGSIDGNVVTLYAFITVVVIVRGFIAT